VGGGARNATVPSCRVEEAAERVYGAKDMQNAHGRSEIHNIVVVS
jgi:hypothetical protein